MSDEHPGTLNVGAVQRTFHVVAPVTPPTSLLLVLHGSDSDAAGIRELSGHTFDRLADEGVLVVYPEAHRGKWNDARLGTQAPARELGIDDVEFLSTLVAGLRRAVRRTRVPGLRGGVLQRRRRW